MKKKGEKIKGKKLWSQIQTQQDILIQYPKPRYTQTLEKKREQHYYKNEFF